MNVMNIKHYLSSVAALAMLAACSDYDPGMSEDVKDIGDITKSKGGLKWPPDKKSREQCRHRSR